MAKLTSMLNNKELLETRANLAPNRNGHLKGTCDYGTTSVITYSI